MGHGPWTMVDTASSVEHLTMECIVLTSDRHAMSVMLIHGLGEA